MVQFSGSTIAIGDYLQGKVNETYPVFEDGVFHRRVFLMWCAEQGIAWPWSRSETTGMPYYSIDDVMKSMESRHPFIAQVRQVNKTLCAFSRKSGVTIDGRAGKHYFGTSVFRSITGRNQPKDFLFGGPKWMRYLIVPEPGYILVYVDYKAQEVGIAGAISGDSRMREMYLSTDAHIEFARMAGAVPPGSTKDTHGATRDKYKTISLGVLYGLSAEGAAAQLGCPVSETVAILEQHKALFPRYWAWSRNWVSAAYVNRQVRTRLDWGCQVPGSSKYRSWMNWPIQSAGSDIMRLTTIYLNQMNVSLLAIVHDGFLLTCRRGQEADLRLAIDAACATAVRQVLGDFQLKWDITTYDHRFTDKDGKPLWNLVTEALQKLYNYSPDAGCAPRRNTKY